MMHAVLIKNSRAAIDINVVSKIVSLTKNKTNHPISSINHPKDFYHALQKQVADMNIKVEEIG